MGTQISPSEYNKTLPARHCSLYEYTPSSEHAFPPPAKEVSVSSSLVSNQYCSWLLRPACSLHMVSPIQASLFFCLLFSLLFYHASCSVQWQAISEKPPRFQIPRETTDAWTAKLQ